MLDWERVENVSVVGMDMALLLCDLTELPRILARRVNAWQQAQGAR